MKESEKFDEQQSSPEKKMLLNETFLKKTAHLTPLSVELGICECTAYPDCLAAPVNPLDIWDQLYMWYRTSPNFFHAMLS